MRRPYPLRERVVNAGAGHRRPVVIDRMREQDEVAKLTIAVAHMVAQQALGLEAERGEQRDGALLIGDHLDVELAEPELDRLQECPPRERAPDAVPAVRRVDHEPYLADVIRPPAERDDGDVAGHRPRGARGPPGAVPRRRDPTPRRAGRRRRSRPPPRPRTRARAARRPSPRTRPSSGPAPPP